MNNQFESIKKQLEGQRNQSLQENTPEKSPEIDQYYQNQYTMQENYYQMEMKKINEELTIIKGKKSLREDVPINEENNRDEKIPRIDYDLTLTDPIPSSGPSRASVMGHLHHHNQKNE